MINLKLQKVQKCPHCGLDKLEFKSWYVNPDNGKVIANFSCEYSFCHHNYFKLVDKIIKELIVR